MEKADKIAIFLGIILLKNNTVLLFQRKQQGDWILPGSLIPLMADFDDIPHYIGLCGMTIEKSRVMGVHEIGEHQYIVTITGNIKDSSLVLTEHYSKAEWVKISDLMNYPIKAGQRPILENALSNINMKKEGILL